MLLNIKRNILQTLNQKILTNNTHILKNLKMLSILNLQNASFCQVKEKENLYSLDEVETILRKYLSSIYRDVNNLPEVFREYDNLLLNLQEPQEPDEYACCGKGCSPCIWDKYDRNLNIFNEIVHHIFINLNNKI